MIEFFAALIVMLCGAGMIWILAYLHAHSGKQLDDADRWIGAISLLVFLIGLGGMIHLAYK